MSDVGTTARSPPAKGRPKQTTEPQVIGDLPYAALKKLSDKLDTPCGNEMNWRKLILVCGGLCCAVQYVSSVVTCALAMR